jgi:hypothetical protein
MTEEQKRRAMLAYFAQNANDPEVSLANDQAIEGVSPEEHERLFEFLKQVGCVSGKVNKFLGGGCLIIGSITSRGIEVHASQLQFEDRQVAMQTFNISHSTNVAAGNNNTIQQTIEQGIQALVTHIEKSGGTPEQKSEAMRRLCEFLGHPLVASVTGAAVGLLGTIKS